MDFCNGKPLTIGTIIANPNDFELILNDHRCVKIINGKIMFCGHISIMTQDVQFINGEMVVTDNKLCKDSPCTNESNIELTHIGLLDNIEWEDHPCLSRIDKFKPYKYEWCGRLDECCDIEQKAHIHNQKSRMNDRITELKGQGHTCVRIINGTSVPQFNWCRKSICGRCN